MTTINWKSEINSKVLRNGTSWNEICGFISDTTRSGKAKRRLAHSMGKRTFSVKMRFTIPEYELFKQWYRSDLLYGANSFIFPHAVDEVDGIENATEYRFTSGSSPKYTNNSADYIDVSMEWEEC